MEGWRRHRRRGAAWHAQGWSRDNCHVMIITIPVLPAQITCSVTVQLQVTVTCERTRSTHTFDVAMSSEERDQHEVCVASQQLSLLSVGGVTHLAGRIRWVDVCLHRQGRCAVVDVM